MTADDVTGSRAVEAGDRPLVAGAFILATPGERFLVKARVKTSRSAGKRRRDAVVVGTQGVPESIRSLRLLVGD